MSTLDEARRAILSSIRSSLSNDDGHTGSSKRRSLPVLRSTAQPSITVIAPPALKSEAKATLVATFLRELREVGGHAVVARSMREAARELERIVQEAKAQRVAVSDSRLARSVMAQVVSNVAWLEGEAAASELFNCDIGLTSAQWGIAETGTLVLESDRERHRLISLVPPIHVALIEATKILPTIGEALARASGQDGEEMSRAVTMITGPSRTADIELTLAIGVHGPCILHVIVVDA